MADVVSGRDGYDWLVADRARLSGCSGGARSAPASSASRAASNFERASVSVSAVVGDRGGGGG